MNTPDNSTKPARKRYDPSFRRQAVELWEASHKTGVEIATELGIKPNRLYSWREKLKPPGVPGTGSTAAPPDPAALALENATLRQEVAHLRQQRDILKKTLGILSEPPGNAIPGLKP